MSAIRTVIILLVVLFSISAAAASEPDDKALYNEALARFREKSYRKAIISFLEFTKTCPGSSLRFSALYNIGLSYNQLGEYLEAVKAFEELEDKAADTIWEARACWKKASAESSVHMMSFTEDKELKERNMSILGIYIRSDELFAGYPGHLEEHCRMMLEKSRFEEKALKDNDREKSTLLKILELHPSKSICCEAFLSLAALRNREKDYDGAISSYRAIVELSPASDYAARAMDALRYLSVDCSDYNEAIAWYKKIISISLKSGLTQQAMEGLAYLAKKNDKYSEASYWNKRILAISCKSDSARNAMGDLAELAEWHGRCKEALSWYYRILKIHPDDEGAKSSIAKIEDQYLALRLQDNRIRQGVKPELTLFSRNISRVSLLAYKVELAGLFRSFRINGKTLEMKLPESPCARWAIDIPDKGDHQRLTTPFEVPLEENGAYILEARTDGIIRRTPVIITNLSLLCASKKDTIVFHSADLKTGEPVEGVELFTITFADSQIKPVTVDTIGRTAEKGLLRYRRVEDRKKSFTIIGRHGDDWAVISDLCLLPWPPEEEEQDVESRTYLYTDRPVYRPGWKVFFKGIARKYMKGGIGNLEGNSVDIAIMNPKGESVYQQSIIPGEFGTVSGEYRLPDRAAPGKWTIAADALDYKCTAEFTVEEYRKPEYRISISPEMPFYCTGEKADVNLSLQYFSGGPVPEGRVQYSVFCRPVSLEPEEKEPFSWFVNRVWYKTFWFSGYQDAETLLSRGDCATDSKGRARLAFQVPDIRKDLMIRIEARATEQSRREVVETLMLKCPRSPWHVKLSAPFKAKPCKNVTVSITTHDFNGSPCSIPLMLKGAMIDEHTKDIRGKIVTETRVIKELFNQAVRTDRVGNAEWSFVPGEEGRVRVEAVVRDRQGRDVIYTSDIRIDASLREPREYAGQVIISTDRESYVPGEKAIISITAEQGGTNAFLYIGGRKYDRTDVVPLKDGRATLEIPVDEGCVPAFNTGAAVVNNGITFTGSRRIVVIPKDKFLTLSLTPERTVTRPGEKSTFTLSARNYQGKPERAELSLDLVDSSVFSVVKDRSADIRSFFYGPYYHTSRWDFGSYSDSWAFMADIGLDMQFLVTEMTMDFRAPPMPRYGESSSMSRGGDEDSSLRVRKNFPDTAFWKADIVTDEKGEARVTVPFPDSLTTWRARAVGVTKDTKVGSITSNIDTRTDFFARLIMPRFLTQNDETLITGVIHNNTCRDLEVRSLLEADGVKLLEQPDRKLSVQAGKEGKVEWKIRAVKAGTATVRIKALAQGQSDAVEMPLKIVPHGVEEVVCKSGELRDGKSSTFTLNLPAGAIPESAECELILSPSLVTTLVESLQYLEKYPFWCTEQAVSRLFPFLLVKKALADYGAGDEDLAGRCDDISSRCLSIIRENQQADGGWAWWKKGESSAWMTAYVLIGLKEAAIGGLAYDQKSIEKGIAYLKSCRIKSSDDETVLKLYAISIHKDLLPDEKACLTPIFRERDRLSDCSRALLLTILDRIGDREKRDVLFSNLEDRAHQIDDMAYYGQEDSTSWQRVKETSEVLKAFDRIRPDHPLIRKMVKYIVSAREGSHWQTTVDTAAAISALADYIAKNRESTGDYPVSVTLNGGKIFEDIVTGEKLLSFPGKIDIPARLLKAGENTCVISAGEKCASLSYSSMLRFFSLQEDIPAEGRLIRIKREYLPENSAGSSEELKEARSGGQFRVRLTIELSRDLDYLVLEDPKPAGCEVPPYAFDDRNSAWIHRELHDDRAVFFFQQMTAGTHTFEYGLRAETPGNYHVMPATISSMYVPSIRGRSAESKLKIGD